MYYFDLVTLWSRTSTSRKYLAPEDSAVRTLGGSTSSTYISVLHAVVFHTEEDQKVMVGMKQMVCMYILYIANNFSYA